MRCQPFIFLVSSALMSIDPRYYTLSGKFSFTGFLGLLLAIPIGTALFGIAYGYASVYWPFSWFNVISCVIYAGACGFLVSVAGYTAHVRSMALMRWLGSLTGLFAWYFGWAFWFYAWSDEQLFPWDPRDLASWIYDLAETGSWTALWVTPKGIALYLVWIIEAGIIFIVVNFLSTASISGSVYCESCRNWAEPDTLEPPLEALADEDPLLKALEDGRMDLLEHLRPAAPEATLALQIQIDSCRMCKQVHSLSLFELRRSFDPNGEASVEKAELLSLLKIKTEDAQHLREFMKSLAPPESNGPAIVSAKAEQST